MFRSVRVACAALVVVVVGGAALGQGIGTGGPFDTNHVLQPVSSIPGDPTVWRATAGSMSVPIPVELDPTGQAWVKHISLPDAASITTDQRVALADYLATTGSLAWTGWQEEILTPDFSWVVSGQTFVMANGASAPGQQVDFAPPGFVAGTGLAFSFDALAVGTELQIYRRLVYTGSEPFTGEITIRGYPTPEPASWAVMAASCAILLKRRGRSELGGQE